MPAETFRSRGRQGSPAIWDGAGGGPADGLGSVGGRGEATSRRLKLVKDEPIRGIHPRKASGGRSKVRVTKLSAHVGPTCPRGSPPEGERPAASSDIPKHFLRRAERARWFIPGAELRTDAEGRFHHRRAGGARGIGRGPTIATRRRHDLAIPSDRPGKGTAVWNQRFTARSGSRNKLSRTKESCRSRNGQALAG